MPVSTHIKYAKIAGASLALAGLAACSLPGYDLEDYGNKSPWYAPAKDDPRAQPDELPEEDQVGYEPELHQITPTLVLNQEPAPARTPLPQSLLEMPQREYTVGPGDVLNVVVFNHPELTNPTGTPSLTGPSVASGRLVNADGEVFFPFVGELNVQGLTLKEIRQKLSEGLSRVIRDPQLDVRVTEFRSHQVYIAGDISTPCAVPITDLPLTVLSALQQCDSLQQGGNNNAGRSPVSTLRLSRNGEIIPLNLVDIYESGELVYLQDGDRLIVDRSASRVFIVGDFQTQTVSPFPAAGMTLNDAIAEGGGLNLTTADAGEIYVIRGFIKNTLDADGNVQTSIRPKIFHLNAKSVAALILADQFQLLPRDVVYAAPASLVSLNRALAQIAPSLNLLLQNYLIYDRLDRR